MNYVTSITRNAKIVDKKLHETLVFFCLEAIEGIYLANADYSDDTLVVEISVFKNIDEIINMELPMDDVEDRLFLNRCSEQYLHEISTMLKNAEEDGFDFVEVSSSQN